MNKLKKKDMKELIERSYKAIQKRGLITENTTRLEFINKIQEELGECICAIDNDKEYLEELTDLITVCMMQIKHLGHCPIEEFEKVVEKNENRDD